MSRLNELRIVGNRYFDLIKFLVKLPFSLKRNNARKLIYASEHVRSRIPLTTLDRLVGKIADTNVVEIKAIETQEHNCSVFELFVIATVAAVRVPQKAFEIGTFDGRSAIALASNLPDGSCVYTLNLPPDYMEGKDVLKADEMLSRKVESGHRWVGLPEQEKITQLWGNSLNFDFEPYAGIGVAFIDGGHEDSVVTKDFESIDQIIDKNDGYILFHDATRYGVRKALERLWQQGRKIHLIAGTSIAVIRYKDGTELDLD